MKKKIAILGTAPSWEDAPFGAKDWEIWVCNRAGLSQGPWDRLFEIHFDWEYEGPEARENYLRKLRSIMPPKEVISCTEIGGSANNVVDRQVLFDKYNAIWFSSSFAYMIGHALEYFVGVDELGFFGVDLDGQEECITQFYGVRHLIDIARERGIKITIPPRSSLAREPNPYPDRFETTLAWTFEERAAILEQRIYKAEHKAREAMVHVGIHTGRLSALEDPPDKYEDRQELQKVTIQARNYQSQADRLKGMLWATQHYRRLFVFNALPPGLDEATDMDTEDSGPT